MTTDPIAAARALIEPLTGYTPGMWEPFFGEAYRVRSDGMTIATAHFVTQLNRIPTKQVAANTALIAAAPDLRDMVATLADALEAERAKVAAAYEAAADACNDYPVAAQSADEWTRYDLQIEYSQASIRTLTPADAQAALDKLLAEARLEGWRAGRDAAADEAALYSCSEGSDEYTKGIQEGYTEAVIQIVDGIRALPEPKETSND